MLRTSTLAAARARSARTALSFLQRRTATSEAAPKDEGDISSVFRSLSGSDESEKLPQRFADIKRGLVTDRDALHASWDRLLRRLKHETETVKLQGSACIPQINYADIHRAPEDFHAALRKRGVAVVRQVVPELEARAFKEETERYVAANPSTRGKPPTGALSSDIG